MTKTWKLFFVVAALVLVLVLCQLASAPVSNIWTALAPLAAYVLLLGTYIAVRLRHEATLDEAGE